MKDSMRTVVLVAVAAVSLVVAWGATRNSDFTSSSFGTDNLGKLFYPEFKDPNAPDQIKVTMIDETVNDEKSFEVKLTPDGWRIPSHYNYPADAVERLAKTSASALDIRRGEIRSTNKKDHVSLGVLDPASSDRKELKGYGRRLTLSSKGKVLLDLIIGKAIEGRSGYYYVRRPEEVNTYVAKLDLDLSTSFHDWVETDLLKFDPDELRSVTIKTDHVDLEKGGVVVKGEESSLTRKTSADPWTLNDVDAKTEELDTAKVNELTTALKSLKLTGVRPKPDDLKQIFKGEGDGTVTREALGAMVGRGFYPARTGIVGAEGEVDVRTAKGVKYVLQFGNTFNGEGDVETGLEKKSDKKDADKKEGEGDDKPAETKKAGRYLLVQAVFDESTIDGKPVPPVKPEPAAEKPATEKADAEKPPAEAPKSDGEKPEAPKPEAQSEGDKKPEGEEKKPDADEKKPEEDKSESGSPNGGAQDEPKPEEKKDEEKKDADKPDAKPAEQPEAKPADETKPAETPAGAKPAADAKPAAAAVAKPAVDLEKEYQQALKKYETDLTAWKKKVTEGKELADKLNARFADWYYVISDEDYNKIRLARKDLVKSKTPAAAAPGLPGLPGAPDSEKTTPPAKPEETAKPDEPAKAPEEKTPAKPEEKAGEKKDGETKEPEAKPEPKPEEPKPEAPKPEEKKPEENKTDEKPPEAKPEENKAEEKTPE